MKEPGDSCPSCGMWTAQGRTKNAERARANPIYRTDFSRPLHQIVEDIRHEITQARGHLSDIRFAFPGWGERTENVEGLLTCGLSVLYNIAEAMEKVELERLGDVVRWHPRGIGTDQTPGCFKCPDSEPGMYSNVAAFVGSKKAGERAVEIIGHGARLDWREHEPNWIQVKVGACEAHLPDLEVLAQRWYIGADMYEEKADA